MYIPKPNPADLKNELGLISTPEYIATGGFKVVFKFENNENITEALKAVFLPPVSSAEEQLFRDQMVARAKREIVALKECANPSIVKLGSLTPKEMSVSGHDYLIYSEEFLPGDSLTAWLLDPTTQVSGDQLYLTFSILIDVIEELSNKGYLHRDIKPDNVMQTGDPDRPLVVLDMGIAYKMEGTELTRGRAPGTRSFMAPELLQMDYKDNMDFRCDLYSAALTVYALAIRSNPFRPGPQAGDVTEYRVTSVTPEPLHTLRSDLPEAFCKIIDRCIRKKPALRYSRIDHLRKELAQSLS